MTIVLVLNTISLTHANRLIDPVQKHHHLLKEVMEMLLLLVELLSITITVAVIISLLSLYRELEIKQKDKVNCLDTVLYHKALWRHMMMDKA